MAMLTKARPKSRRDWCQELSCIGSSKYLRFGLDSDPATLELSGVCPWIHRA